jgi:hypothetical protein
MYHVKNTIKISSVRLKIYMRAPGTPVWKDVWNLGRIAKEMECANLTPKLTGHIRLMPVRMPLQVMSECLQAHK